MLKLHRTSTLGIVAAACLAAVATAFATSPQAPQDLKSLKGAIRVDGSSTVYPLSEAVAEDFSKVAPGVRVTVGLSGTGGGFKRFCEGQTDISNASRPIKKSEIDAAKKSNIEYVELPVAYDGLSIVVNPKNTWVKSLTVDQLKKIYSASGTAKTWKDVDPSWPADPIKVYSPGTDSGTFDYFKEVVVGKDGKIRADMSVSEDDNALVTGIAGDINAIGYFGCAYYFENKDKVKDIPIDGGKGPVAPSAETILGGTYVPFSRPLFIYVNRKAADRAEVQAFVNYFLDNAGELADDVGYVHLPADLYARAKKNWADRRTGTQMSDEKGEGKPGTLAELYK
ncbi:MAG: PstS family phosphate ABC transporter substrate-binding protein [Phycisphaerae bacterium]|nr:PstS family phosphate ABC transporter substrate-binding protein [Phycisphaerae bacterium]